MNSEAIRTTLRITKAISDLQRVRILMLLQGGELCVCQIVEVLALASSTISKHLSILSNAGLVDFRKEGRWAYYRLHEGASGVYVRPVSNWLNDALKNDKTIEQDMKKLKTVVASDPESLCRRQRNR